MSYFHYEYMMAQGGNRHEGKAKIDQFDSEHRTRMINYARLWAEHCRYWYAAPLRRHVARYEDIREDPVTQVMAISTHAC